MIKDTFISHWKEYLIEAWGLGTFMISAIFFTALVEHPAFGGTTALVDEPVLRRLLIGLAMGFTAVGIIYSPWGKKSGAHINPAVTLAFLKLGKIEKGDATFYIIFQFVGGLTGVILAGVLFPAIVTHPKVNYAVTVPGSLGVTGAFLLEMLLSFTLFMTILFASNSLRYARYTGIFAGIWLAIFITLEAPFSGMSINPARTVASALPANVWSSLWIYFVAPILGMWVATILYPKYCHNNKERLKCHMSGHKNNCCTYCE